MRTPAEIFADVLSRYDELRREQILARVDVVDRYGLVKHGDEVRALRAEFREAYSAYIMTGPSPSLVGTGSGTVVVPDDERS